MINRPLCEDRRIVLSDGARGSFWNEGSSLSFDRIPLLTQERFRVNRDIEDTSSILLERQHKWIRSKRVWVVFCQLTWFLRVFGYRRSAARR